MQTKMNNEEVQVSQRSYSMNGGNGPHSYVHNSSIQKRGIISTHEMVKEAVKNKLELWRFCSDQCSDNKIRIADLGCSVGPNTFIAMQYIIEAIENKYKTEFPESPTPEFQVFFNDTMTNDFNLLFKSLPPSRRYFIAGAPGSFYGRLFPKQTIHFAYCSSALNWLSGVPTQATDRSSPAWNKGNIYCTGTEKEVTEAFWGQYKRDILKFLSARAEELVSGGFMVILLGGLLHDTPMSKASVGKVYGLLGSCLVDMAEKGLISKEKLDSFNLPLYFPSSIELKNLIEKNGCFSIERIDGQCIDANAFWQNIQMTVTHIRAAFEVVIESHFGNEIVEELFQRYTKKFRENIFMFDEGEDNFRLLSIILKRKNTSQAK